MKQRDEILIQKSILTLFKILNILDIKVSVVGKNPFHSLDVCTIFFFFYIYLVIVSILVKRFKYNWEMNLNTIDKLYRYTV